MGGLKRRVLKFGGTSVGTAAALRSALEIAETAARERPVVIVVSALAGVTNALEAALAGAAASRLDIAGFASAIRDRHLALLAAVMALKGNWIAESQPRSEGVTIEQYQQAAKRTDAAAFPLAAVRVAWMSRPRPRPRPPGCVRRSQRGVLQTSQEAGRKVLPREWLPRLVLTVESLPMLPSGKPDRAALRLMAAGLAR